MFPGNLNLRQTALLILLTGLAAAHSASGAATSAKVSVLKLEERLLNAKTSSEARRHFRAAKEKFTSLGRDVMANPEHYAEEEQTFLLGLAEIFGSLTPDMKKSDCIPAKRAIVFGYAPQAETWDSPTVLRDLPEEAHVALRLVDALCNTL